MKARKVGGLDPSMPLGEAAARIVEVRLEELCALAPAARDPRNGAALHDMRIAAKRLRYVLELTEGCFGPYAAKARKHARTLQDVIGEIHDWEVMIDRVDAHLETLRATDATYLLDRGADSSVAAPSELSRAPSRSRYRGLEGLAAYCLAQRRASFERFCATWQDLEREGLRRRLRRALRHAPAHRRVHALAGAEGVAAVADPALTETAGGAG